MRDASSESLTDAKQRIVGIALERRVRSQVHQPSGSGAVVGVEPARRRLVAGQHELDLEVELIVRRRSASTPGAPRATRRREETRRTAGG